MKPKLNQIKFKYVVVLVFVFILTSFVYPQYEFYYGKNKVMRQSFDWQYVETPHFKIYYYTPEKALVNKISKAAEFSYTKLSDYLGVKIKDKIPLIFYSTHIDFEQTNIIGYVPPGALAFAESTTYRVVIQGDAPFDELATTITHELTHLFEYEIIGPSSRYVSPPLWIMEGFSEFMAGEWGEFNLLTVRDMVLADRIPQMGKNGDLETEYYNDRIIPYDFGHIIYEFLEAKYGKRGIKKLLLSTKSGGLLRFASRSDALKGIDLTPKMFNYEFGKYLRERFKPFFTKESPEDYSFIIGPDLPYAYTFTHQISPSGELVAILTVSLKTYQLEIVLISMKDGKVIKRITPGFTTKYDNINLKFDPTEGLSFSWNKKSNSIAFFARKELDNYLVIYDVLSNQMLKRIKIEGIQDPSSPVFNPMDENKIYFTGQEYTKSYLYSMDLSSGKTIKHTNGLLFVKAFDISEDGKQIVYSAKIDGHYKIFYGVMDNPDMSKQVTFGNYNDITPSFSSDSRYIYYSSNELGSYNVNSIDLKDSIMNRYTDVKTGNFFPIEIPGEKDMLVISSYYKGQFVLFKKDISKPEETKNIELKMIDTELLTKKETEAVDTTGLGIEYKGKYSGLGKLYVKSLPPINIAVGTDGGVWGYTELTLTDLFGDNEFSMLLSTFYGYRSYHLSYLNLKHRLQLYAHFFSFQDVYFYNQYYYGDYLTLRSMYGGEVGVFYPFSRSTRLELTAAIYKQKENFTDYYEIPDTSYGQFFSGWALPLRVSLVNETTLFANYGPNRGGTFNLTFEKYIKVGNKFQDAYVVTLDARKYLRLDSNTLLAFRAYGSKAGGKNSYISWTGGNNTLRGVPYRGLAGENLFLFNAEFRFPLVHLAATPLGLIGPLRGTFFFDFGGAWFDGQDFRIFQKDNGLRLQDAISSYGFGLQFFFLGYPMHFDWVWRTDFKRRAYQGVNFWIGFDF